MAGMQFVARFVPFIFGVIGIGVIFSMWTWEDDWTAPPTIFKVFASLIASVFCVVGFGGAFFGPKFARSGRSGRRRGRKRRRHQSRGDGYTCPHCQGGLESQVEVSPSGDVKCAFCERWFNIHD
ncbi:MAG: hypothetical protein ACI8QC_004365 [Planctomycetota bacterium]|jgi:hypothetical protein